MDAAGDKPQLTKVEMGLRTPGEVEMKASLSKVDVVVTEGQTRLRDGGGHRRPKDSPPTITQPMGARPSAPGAGDGS